jgi:hypothetical protein
VEHDDTPGHLDDALPDDARAMIVGWPFTTVKCLAQRGDALMLVVDSHGEGEALVERLHDADIAAELVPFEYVSAAVATADVVIIEALACGANSVLAVGGSRAVVDTAAAQGKQVWLVAGVGTRLPTMLWSGMVSALQINDDWRAGLDVIDVNRFTRVVGPLGHTTDTAAEFVAECPATAELLRRSVI